MKTRLILPALLLLIATGCECITITKKSETGDVVTGSLCSAFTKKSFDVMEVSLDPANKVLRIEGYGRGVDEKAVEAAVKGAVEALKITGGLP